MAKKPLKYQNIHKIAEVLAEEPNLSNAEIAERIGSTETSVQNNRVFLNHANGNAEQAILARNKRDLDHRKAKSLEDASSPDFGKPLIKIEGQTLIHRLAKFDLEHPGLTARQAAAQLGSTVDTIFQYRQALLAAEGDPDKAAQLRVKKATDWTGKNKRDAAKRREHQEWIASGIDD